MADKNAKNPENVPGFFYVDDQCIACDACCVAAPLFFSMDQNKGHAYVSKQPLKDLDIEQCIDALECCPVDAIGKDGDS